MLIRRRRKLIAAFFLFIFTAELLIPATSFALTNGPSQPEMAKFEPAGANDLVDLFTGDLKYNIALLDVGGYPINLSYQSGTTMDEEASWVGTGWTLNPGAVNRTMRGLPDDFDGSKGDAIEKTYMKKEFRKIGAQVVIKPTVFGWEVGNFSGSGSLKLNVYKDNYYGAGASLGASVGFNVGKNMESSLTAGLNIDITSDTRNGVDVSPSFSIERQTDDIRDCFQSTPLSGHLEYNTRQGLKSISLNSTYDNGFLHKISLGYQREFGQTYTPSIQTNTASSGLTFHFDVGPAIFGGYVGIGGSGYGYRERLLQPVTTVQAYGYLNYLKARKNETVLLDFNREKDGVFITSTPAIAIPVATPDYFMATGQAGSYQFRPYFGGNYVVFDKAHTNLTNNTTIGLTVGGGNLYETLGRIDNLKGIADTRKWSKNNAYLTYTDEAFNTTTDPLAEPVYFKQTGEPGKADKSFFNLIGNNDAVKVSINNRLFQALDANAYSAFKTRETSANITSPIKKATRDKRNLLFSYLDGAQASRYGLDKDIKNYSTSGAVTTIPRIGTYRKGHHISEITITDNTGKRMVYGTPVINKVQEEVTFSIPPPASLETARRTGIISYAVTPGPNENGRDWLYNKEVMPAYATSYLLTGILSPDYIDLTNNGITDDDPGTAIKFNYTRRTDNYKWRAPYNQNTASFNEGFISDTRDDKASYVYGEKEVWYLYAVETKTMIAIFKTSDRQDGLGVLNANGGKNTSVKLQKLESIKLYSKPEWLLHGTNAIPIKTVNFEYDYSLYPDVSNNTGSAIDKNGNALSLPSDPANVNVKKGKLTLKRVYFTFGTSTKGTSNPYEFEYDERIINPSSIPGLPAISPSDDEFNDRYFERQSDRWAVYKKSYYNRVINGQRVLNNSEFPYSPQENINTAYSERLLADRFASKWQLNKITTPSGGIITVDYESDDYAYVQDRRAMQMCFVKGLDNTIPASTQPIVNGLINANRVVVELPRQVANLTEFKNFYLRQADGRFMEKMFYKMMVDVNGKGTNYEYINGYAEIDIDNCGISGDGKTGYIAVKKFGNYNPMAKAAWQMVRTDLPQFAYDNYDNSEVADFKAVITALAKAFTTFKELAKPADKRAADKKFANAVNWQKSMVRLFNPGTGNAAYSKIGGGTRVKKIQLSDEWSVSSGIAGSNSAKYGQLYDYSLRDESGNFISSSGVATYEPQIGNEENPFREPDDFVEKVHWSSDRYHYVQKPYCESYFPAASVGYSKVTVTSFGDDYAQTGNLIRHTGYVENEFYTAKDFPTIVDKLPRDQTDYKKSLSIQLFSSQYYNHVVTSQGFKVELNDMHGKAKSIKVFNKARDLVSSTENFYSVQNEGAETKELKNEVDVLKRNGSIEPGITLATDIDFTTDVRQSTNISIGTSIGRYTGGMLIPSIPPFIPFSGVKKDQSVTSNKFNSISSVKIIHRYGILKKVRTTQNGSTIEAENLLWDEETGQVLLTRTQSEHDKDLYTFIYPAYMVKEYDGMGGAYQNAGMIIKDPLIEYDQTPLEVNPALLNLQFPDGRPYLLPGDELVNITSAVPIRGWIKYTPPLQMKTLIDKNGSQITENGTYMIIRSGRRNLVSASAGTVITMKDPRVDGKIKLDDAALGILDSKVQLYGNRWHIAGRDYYIATSSCNPVAGGNFNPFFTGVFANWRPDTSFVYVVDREQVPGNPALIKDATDIRNSGHYSSYAPFWEFISNGHGIQKHIYATNQTADTRRWKWTSRPVFYDAYGNMVESETPGTDPANPSSPLSHFGAALYGYHKTLPVAVGANTRLNEMIFDGFEDYNFAGSLQLACPFQRHYNFGTTGAITTQLAHSGKYSYRISSALNLNFTAGNSTPADNPSSTSYAFTDNDLNKGFRPVQNRKYLLSFWVNDHAPASATVQNLTVKVNGVNQQVNTMVVPSVEGWKKVDIVFVFQPNGTPPNHEIELIPGATIELDDIRILPFDGQMNAWVYDETTVRLVAQLDENNFATFYEYDDEGIPVRVKKETDRGILTLKENRQSVRKRN